MLDPGRGRTKTGQLWAYARDDPPWGGTDPPAVASVYASDRRAADRPSLRLHDILQVDGYAGYRAFAERGDGPHVFCWAVVRRRFYELAAAEPAPIASEALERIAELYTIEGEIRGRITDVTISIVNGHSNSQIDDLLPWACPAAQDLKYVA